MSTENNISSLTDKNNTTPECTTKCTDQQDLSNAICKICNKKLSRAEKYILSNGEYKLSDDVCEKHWCECLPNDYAYGKIYLCSSCNLNTICDYCKCVAGGKVVCQKCPHDESAKKKFCEFCNVQLTAEELHVLNINLYDDSSIVVCRNHWCYCLPTVTPWSWIQECPLCDRTFCKTCKSYKKGYEWVCHYCGC